MDQALCRDEHVRAFNAVRRDLGLGGAYACR
jgi:hypothetical protein